MRVIQTILGSSIARQLAAR